MTAARLGDRSLFPDLAFPAYLNHGAISPPSLPVRRAVVRALDDYAARGAGAFPTWIAQRAGLRRKLGQLIGLGSRGEDIALMPNTTRGVVDVALSFPWRRGDSVVVFRGEFPANVTPWQRAAELFGLELHWVDVASFAEDQEHGLAKLEETLELAAGTSRARLVAVSAVEFQSGLRMPLTEMASLAHAHGAELFVDAVQAVGAVPIDVAVSKVDYLCAGSHKWLMGPEGGGFLYVSPERVEALLPNVAGWLSHEDPVGFLVRGPGLLRYDRGVPRRAGMFEGGNVNTAGLAGLEASVDILLSLGVPAIFTHVNAILDALEPELVARGFVSVRSKDPRQRSCTLSLTPPRGVDVVELQKRLATRGVSCSIPDGLLRFTPHWPNHVDQVPFVLRAVDASLAAS